MADAQPTPPAVSRDVEENRLTAALAWLWVLSVVLLLAKRDSPYVQFHARQGLVVFLASIFLWMIISLALPFALQQLLKIIVFAVSVTGFVQALRGRWWTLPIVGTLAARIRL